MYKSNQNSKFTKNSIRYIKYFMKASPKSKPRGTSEHQTKSKSRIDQSPQGFHEHKFNIKEHEGKDQNNKIK